MRGEGARDEADAAGQQDEHEDGAEEARLLEVDLKVIRMPVKMMTTPTKTSSQPATERPLKNSSPTPKTSGSSDSPKAL